MDHLHRRAVGILLPLLGRHLDLYQVHSATLDSGLFEQPALLSALAGLREQGIAVGLSVSGPAQGETIRRALAVEIDGRPLFQSVQTTWNLLERSAGVALAEAKAAGWLVIVKEALANGRLAARGGVAPLIVAASRLGTTPELTVLRLVGSRRRAADAAVIRPRRAWTTARRGRGPAAWRRPCVGASSSGTGARVP